jgi:hypothetical protein
VRKGVGEEDGVFYFKIMVDLFLVNAWPEALTR